MESHSGRTPRPSVADAAIRRRSSTLHYQTFANIKPPTGRGRLNFWSRSSSNVDGSSGTDSPTDAERTPLPWKQLGVLAVMALIEQTAFNSIGPYLPEMTGSFPEVREGQVGLYVGLIASAFALAQFTTNYFWGWLSDRIGRKPVILFGTVMSAAAFLAFGFSRRFWHAMLSQIILGVVNGNQVLVATVLGEITDKSNQSRAFTYLPVLFAIGGITGPALGGLLVDRSNPFDKDKPNPYPYLLPNIVCSILLGIQACVIMIFLKESLDEASELPSLGKRLSEFLTWLWGATTSHIPVFLRSQRTETNAAEQQLPPTVLPAVGNDEAGFHIYNTDVVLLLATYFIFQLSNVAYNVLYPIFGEGKPPTGRNLSTEAIGISLACAGVLTILFQIFIYGPIRAKMGNRMCYRLSHLLYAVAFVIMPFVGYIDGTGFGQGRVWVWVEIGVSLVLKTIAAVGGLTCAMMMITNSAGNNAVLGRLNGLAQTLSAAGRAIGPFVSGGLFSAASRLKTRGEALPFGIFTGIALLGFGLSLGIRDESLEAEDWDEHDESAPLLRS